MRAPEPQASRVMNGIGELLLYLHYDGALHNHNVLWHPNIGPYLSNVPDGCVLFQHAGLLKQLLAPYPQLKIVLATARVRRYGCVHSAKHLRPSLRARVIGATFHSRINKQDFGALPRGVQVWNDVPRRRPRSWLALDDDGIDWPEGCRVHFIQTNASDDISDPIVLVEIKAKLAALCA